MELRKQPSSIDLENETQTSQTASLSISILKVPVFEDRNLSWSASFASSKSL